MSDVWKQLDECIPEMMVGWNVPGLSAAVVQDGETVYARGFGSCIAGRPADVDAETIFAVGSNTKAFTATGVGLLVQEGKLSWDDLVTRYLPGFQLYDPAATRLMAVRDLLCHRSGLMTFGGDFMSFGTCYTPDEVLERVRYVRPVHPFRGGYGYSNIMFLAAGKIIETVSGKSWHDFVRERLLEPLGMARTVTSATQLAGLDNIALPHAFTRGQMFQMEYNLIDAIAPAGSINSSAADMAKWLRFQLAGGRQGERQLVETSILEETRTPHTLVPLTAEERQLVPGRHLATYGLGWALWDYGGRLVVSHSGGVDGMLSQTAFLPEEGLGLVVLTNGAPNRLFQAVMFTILDMALGRSGRDWNAAMRAQQEREQARAAGQRKKLEESRLRDTHPSLPLANYTGAYTNPVYGRMNVSLDGGKLCLHPGGHPNMTGPMEHWHADSFLCTWSNPTYEESFVHFQAGMDGKAERLRLKVADFIDMQEYEFIREG